VRGWTWTWTRCHGWWTAARPHNDPRRIPRRTAAAAAAGTCGAGGSGHERGEGKQVREHRAEEDPGAEPHRENDNPHAFFVIGIFFFFFLLVKLFASAFCKGLTPNRMGSIVSSEKAGGVFGSVSLKNHSPQKNLPKKN
jgi:hypothetical protein